MGKEGARPGGHKKLITMTQRRESAALKQRWLQLSGKIGIPLSVLAAQIGVPPRSQYVSGDEFIPLIHQERIKEQLCKYTSI